MPTTCRCGPFRGRGTSSPTRIRRWWPRRRASCSGAGDCVRVTMAAMSGPPKIDSALVRAAQHGDQIAVADLMDILAPYVGRVCGPIALQDGPDAAQEALIAILKNLGGLREPGAIYGWARAIAVREAVRVARQAARAVPAELADVPAPGDPQLAADVRDVLARLTPEHRAPEGDGTRFAFLGGFRLPGLRLIDP